MQRALKVDEADIRGAQQRHEGVVRRIAGHTDAPRYQCVAGGDENQRLSHVGVLSKERCVAILAAARQLLAPGGSAAPAKPALKPRPHGRPFFEQDTVVDGIPQVSVWA